MEQHKIDLLIELEAENHAQIIVLYDGIEDSEKFAAKYPGSMLYADTDVSIRNRVLESEHKFNHVFSFAMCDAECKELYFKELGSIGKYYWSQAPKGKVTFIYINQKNVSDFAQNLTWYWVGITEFKTGSFIEV